MKRLKEEKIVNLIRKDFDVEHPVIFMTEHALVTLGDGASILSLITNLMRNIKSQGMPKKAFEDCLKLTLMTQEELDEYLEKEKNNESSDTDR